MVSLKYKRIERLLQKVEGVVCGENVNPKTIRDIARGEGRSLHCLSVHAFGLQGKAW